MGSDGPARRPRHGADAWPASAPEGGGPSRGPYAGSGDAALVAGGRAGDPAAWDAFFVRFEPVLVRDARRLGVPDAVRDDLVCATLGAVLEQLADPTGVVPGALAGYLRVALRHRAHNAARGARRRAHRDLAAAEPVGDCAGVVASAVSAYTVRLTDGPVHESPGDADDPDPGRVFEPVRTLGHALAAALRPGERALLEQHQAGTTHRALAVGLGISPAAVAKRLARLRARLHAAAEAYVATLTGEERREVCRFLGRARGLRPDQLAAGRVAPDHVGPPATPVAWRAISGGAGTPHGAAPPAPGWPRPVARPPRSAPATP